jgi:sigma-B regulation protein RsbU (phosphoserine phosphatase)
MAQPQQHNGLGRHQQKDSANAVHAAFWSIHLKIGVIFAGLSIVLGLTITAYYQQQTAKLLLAASDSLFLRISDELTYGFQRTYQPVAQSVSLLSRTALTNADSVDKRLKSVPMLAEALTQQPEVTALQIGYNNGDYFLLRQLQDNDLRNQFSADKGTYYLIDYVDGRHPSQLSRIHLNQQLTEVRRESLSSQPFDPRTRPWYTAAMQHSRITTTAPYLFFFTKRLGMTVARQAENGRAVVAADIKLESLSHTLAKFSISPGAETVLYQKDGQAIAYRDQNRLHIASSADNDTQTRIAQVADLHIPVLTQLAVGPDAALPEGWYGRVIALPMASEFTPQLAIAVPTEELLGSAYDIRSQGIVVAAVLILLVIPLSLLIARSVSRPLRDLRDATSAIADGNFDIWLPPATSRDEVGELNYAFREMRVRLIDHIENLKTTTAEKERLQSEISIAHGIQMAMVPGDGSAIMALEKWQLFAKLLPARSVGGDLYDVIDLGNGKYFILLGDVSDKGVPAALFMARTVTLAKLLAVQQATLPEFLSTLNDELSFSNESCMFVTLFCAILDVNNGDLRYACAGHNPPILSRSGKADWLSMDAGSPLGLFAGAEYTESALTLSDDDMLLVYSDGITEAFNESQQEFSDERLLTMLDSRDNLALSATQIGENVLRAVAEFSGNTAQSDDITLMVIKRSQ